MRKKDRGHLTTVKEKGLLPGVDLNDAASLADVLEQEDASELPLKRMSLAEKVRLHREGYERYPASEDEFTSVSGARTWPR